MNLIGKKILIVCREVDSLPYYFLAKRWMKNNTVAAYFIKASETKFHKNISNDISYFAFKDIENLKVYDVNQIADTFTASLKEDKILDPDFLEMLEREYTHFHNLNTQIISSQSFIRHYHFRYFWKLCTYTQQLNWLLLSYKDAMFVMNEFQPDVVINTDSDEIGRCALREICYKRAIPNITIEYPRYEMYKTFTYSLGSQIEENFRHYYINLSKGSIEHIKEELEYVDDFKRKSNIMSTMYKNDITSQYKPDSFLKVVCFIIRFIILMFKQDVCAGNWTIKRSNPVLYPSTSGYFKYFTHCIYLKQMLMRKNRFFKKPIEGEKYVYMPLHLIPESTTSILSPFYINELSVIEAVSKSIPAGWFLYVKEHQAMLGERSLSFYKAINKLPNVKMVQLNYYNDPKPWITKSQGVVTISGTSAYEAALLGKHSIVFSEVPFGLIDGVHRATSFEKLPEIFAKFSEPLQNEQSCAAYIRAVKEFGEEIDLKFLIRNCPQYIKEHSEPNEEVLSNICNIEKVILKALSNFNKFNS